MARYDATAHDAQMIILRHLLFVDVASFAELRNATQLSSDHANFHIKQLLASGFVARPPKSYGKYTLTQDGKEYANRMDTDDNTIEKQPKLSVVLDIVNNKDERLQQERLKQPYFGYWGRPTGKIRWGETMLEAAARELMEETGLTADLSVQGFCHKLDYDHEGNLLEDKYFCLVHGTNPRGKLLEMTDGQRNVWLSDEDFEQKDKKFGSNAETSALVGTKTHFVTEQRYTYPNETY